MGPSTRLPLLMLTTILGNFPPWRAPGGPSGAPNGTAECPKCHEFSDAKSGNLFWCEDCRIWFDSNGKIRRRAGS